MPFQGEDTVVITAIKAQFKKDMSQIPAILKDAAGDNFVRRDLSAMFTFLAGAGTAASASHSELAATFGGTIATWALLSFGLGWYAASRARSLFNPPKTTPRPWIAGLTSAVVSLTSSSIGMVASLGIAAIAGPSHLAHITAMTVIIIGLATSQTITSYDESWKNPPADEPRPGAPRYMPKSR